MIKNPIDVWNIETFDEDLLSKLEIEKNLIHSYFTTDRKNFINRQASDRRDPQPTNPYASSFNFFVEHIIMPIMEKRSLRAWHYTRLTDAEVESLQQEGIRLSTLEMIKCRLEVLALEGILSSENVSSLYATSPFHEQGDIRSNRFWLTSHPLPVDDFGVVDLLKNWGGESICFSLTEPKLVELVKNIGCPRVLEIEVPLNATEHTFDAAEAVVAAFGRSLECETDKQDFDLFSTRAFDLFSTRALDPIAVLKIHSSGGSEFNGLARGYPQGFKYE